MVQAYHAVPVSEEYEGPDDVRGVEHEGSALLGANASIVGLAKNNVEREGQATLMSSVSNLANTIIGSGAWAVFSSIIIPHCESSGMLTFPRVRSHGFLVFYFLMVSHRRSRRLVSFPAY